MWVNVRDAIFYQSIYVQCMIDFDSDCDDDSIYGESDVHVCQCETLTQI